MQQAPVYDGDDFRSELATHRGETVIPLLIISLSVYVMLSIAHAFLLPAGDATLMASIAVVTAVIISIMLFWVSKFHTSASITLGFAIAVVAMATVNSLAHIFVTAEIKHSTNVALVIVGTGYVLLPSRWFTVTMFLQVTLWLAIVVTRTAGQDWPHYLFMIIQAVFLSVLLHRARFISVRNAARAVTDERRFRATFETNGVGSFVLNPDGQIQILNSTASEIFNRDYDQLQGTDFRQLLNPESRQRFDKMRNNVATRSGRFIDNEIVGFRNDGNEFAMRVSVGQLGEGPELIVNVVDLTELHELQEQLSQSRRLKAIGQLTGGIAHDFNNLLQVILCEVESMRREKSNQSAIEGSLNKLCETTDRARTLIQQMLTFSQNQSARARNVNLNTVVVEMLNLIERSLGETIELDFRPAAAPAIARVDVGLLEQILLNLCINARDAMPDGGHLLVAIHELPVEPAPDKSQSNGDSGIAQRRIRLEVTDSGCGMDEATKARIFEPFFTSKPPDRGTGLGLSTVHGIIHQLGGEIHVQSELGVGTSFYVDLPAAKEVTPVIQPRIPTTNARGSEVILFAEDNDLVRNGVMEMLEGVGYLVMPAPNGQRATELFQQHANKIDLVILDVVMPVMSGVDAATEIRNSHPDIPIIFTSGYDQGKLTHSMLADPSNHFVKKPFESNSILSTIREVFDDCLEGDAGSAT